jgi:hypothetical protein
LVTLLVSKILQILYKYSWEHEEQLFFLAQLQIPKGMKVINSATKLKLKFPRILKGFNLFWKNLINYI